MKTKISYKTNIKFTFIIENFSGALPPNSKFMKQILKLSMFIFIIFESFLKYLYSYLYSSQNISQRAQRAQRAERAGPRPFSPRAGPGRAEKSRPVRTSSMNLF